MSETRSIFEAVPPTPYELFCQARITPIVTQFNDGAITIDELASAIYAAILEGAETNWGVA